MNSRYTSFLCGDILNLVALFSLIIEGCLSEFRTFASVRLDYGLNIENNHNDLSRWYTVVVVNVVFLKEYKMAGWI